MLTIHGRRYDTGEPVRIRIQGDRIAAVEPAWPDGDVAAWPTIAPGLFDLQINGHGGVWFSDEALTPEQVVKAVGAYPRFGVTRLCPTLITNSFAALSRGFEAIRQACEQDPLVNRLVTGCHLEGPYISTEDGPRGAHPKEHVRPADWDEFQRLQESSGGRIRLVTLAPEADGAIDFIQRATAAGVVIAIGHTAATPEQVRAAVDAGATLSTHLGNGSHAMLHRHRNYVWEQLADPRLTASLIVDGHHLPAALVRIFVKAKSPRNIVLTCDAAGWAGCPPGVYESKLGRSELLESGRLVVAGQRELLAGSALETDVCVTQVREFAGVSWRDAIDMTSRNPAKLLGYEPARLRRGGLADLFLFRHQPGATRLDVSATIAGGQVCFGSLADSPT
ncbi:MAG: amidohydrolase family protein [Planctomycetaceae bacterium]|nr:amidohydrolase family protein [Planctomycetaceae bacterium]